jgi:hypothetical protein
LNSGSEQELYHVLTFSQRPGLSQPNFLNRQCQRRRRRRLKWLGTNDVDVEVKVDIAGCRLLVAASTRLMTSVSSVGTNGGRCLTLICRLLTIGVAVAAETLAFRTKVSMLMMIVNGGRHVPHVEWFAFFILGQDDCPA